MDRANNPSKKQQTRDWVHRMPCGDKSHKHQNPVYEAAARAICRLPKLIVARKVDGVYRESAEHRGSVTSEMVASVNGQAVTLVKEHEDRKANEAEEEEVPEKEDTPAVQKVSFPSAIADDCIWLTADRPTKPQT